MLTDGKIGESNIGGPRPLSIGISILVHACVLSVLAGSRPLVMPRPRSAYDQLIRNHEHQLIWYHFKDKLPQVRPTRAKSDDRPLRAEVRNRQQIVSAPRNAPKAPQMIWQQAPEINTQIKLDSPNLVAVSLPKIAPPKEFVPPVPQPKKPATPKVDLPPPPDLKTGGAPKPVEIAGLHELPAVSRPLRDFQPPPPPKPKAGPPQVSYVDPSPALVAAAAVPKSAVLGQVAETTLAKVYRPFEAPHAPAKSGKAAVAVPVLPSPPPPDAASTSPGELNAVVVGLNPGNQLPALPPVSRPADFSAGPKVNPKGSAGDGSPAGISVPDLTIRSGNIDTRNSIMARNSMPKSIAAPNQNDALREAARSVTVEDGHPSAIRVASAPDSHFDGRTVYMMAIQMVNTTSHSGSWLMWYSERTARAASTAAITPPDVRRKVDPKYAATAVTERVEGTVRLTAVIHKDGTVGSVELARKLDERLDTAAEEALSRWLFTPAMRNGEPIDVDILVEIPFRLAPILR